MRPLVRRASTWETLAKAMPASKQAEFNASAAAFRKRKEKASATTENASIDFASYENVLGADEVNRIRKEYESHQYTNFEADKETELKKVQEQLNTVVGAIEEQAANMSNAASKASDELDALQRTRTTLQTTTADVMRQYPELALALEERLDNEDWDTENKPVDITSLRLKAIEDNWDASELGKLDENSQKEFLDEINALEPPAATDAETPEHLQTYIDEWHTLLGRTRDPAAEQAFIEADKVTEGDLAMTNEREIWKSIDMAAEQCHFERANGLVEHAKKLRESGELVVDEDWRQVEIRKITNSRRHQDYNTLPTPQELEGKCAEELEALADAAAEAADYYKATHYMYAARVASGEVDTSATDLETLSGFANFFVGKSKTMSN